MPAALPPSAVPPPPFQSDPLAGLSAERVSAVHWEAICRPRWPHAHLPALPGALHWVGENHRCNALLWACQEQAAPLSTSETALGRQDIETFNRQRQEAIDLLDGALLEALEGTARRPGSRPPGETVGRLIDRLSTNALQIFHLGLQVQCPGSWETRLGTGADRLAQLRLQRAAWMQELDLLLCDMGEGRLSYPPDRLRRASQGPALDPCSPPVNVAF